MYHFVEKPCHVACEAPLLNENSTAIAIGTIDHRMYSQVKASIAQGRRHGLPRGRSRRASVDRPEGAVEDWSSVVAIRRSPSKRGRC